VEQGRGEIMKMEGDPASEMLFFYLEVVGSVQNSSNDYDPVYKP
jgi:hypothetical protein